jgi:hypothetical protein
MTYLLDYDDDDDDVNSLREINNITKEDTEITLDSSMEDTLEKVIENAYLCLLTSMLQAGRPGVRFSMRSLDFSTDLILPVALRALGSTQPLT